MKFKERVDKTFNKYGEDFTVNGTAAKGFFQIMDHNRMLTYFDTVESSYITKPGLIVLVPADTPAQAANTIARDGRTYTVAKIVPQRIQNTVVMKTLLLT